MLLLITSNEMIRVRIIALLQGPETDLAAAKTAWLEFLGGLGKIEAEAVKRLGTYPNSPEANREYERSCKEQGIDPYQGFADFLTERYGFRQLARSGEDSIDTANYVVSYQDSP